MIRMIFILFGMAAWVMPACESTHPETDLVTSETVLETTTSWDGTPIAYPEGQAKITGMVIEIAPGAETGWHYHPVPNFGFLLEGELEVQLEDGRSITLEEGDAISEVVNIRHTGRNTGSDPARIVVFYTGIEGGELTILEDK